MINKRCNKTLCINDVISSFEFKEDIQTKPLTKKSIINKAI